MDSDDTQEPEQEPAMGVDHPTNEPRAAAGLPSLLAAVETWFTSLVPPAQGTLRFCPPAKEAYAPESTALTSQRGVSRVPTSATP